MIVSWIRRERMWVRWGNWNAIENAIGTETETEIEIDERTGTCDGQTEGKCGWICGGGADG